MFHIETRFKHHSLAVVLLLGAFAPALAQEVTLLAPQDVDLAVSDLTTQAPIAQPWANTRRERVTFSQALTGDALNAHATPFEALSREYTEEVSGADLNRGITLHAQGAGAVVRITPLHVIGKGTASQPIDPKTLQLGKGKNRLRPGEGMEQALSAEQLATVGVFPSGATSFRIAAGQGKGPFTLRADSPQAEDQRYAVNVLDKGSDIALSLRADANSYLSGQALTLNLKLGQGRTRMTNATGFILSPTGQRYPIAIDAAGQTSYATNIPLDLSPEARAGLWELHTQVQGPNLRRDAKTAFALSAPSARLMQTLDVSHDASGNLVVTSGIEVGAASRYALRAVLYGTNAQGRLQPVAVAHGATWLEPGQGDIQLVFDAKHLSDAHAPYELHDLQLMDQGRMGVLHRQARAAVIN